MDTQTLQLFVDVARLGSFAAAARSQDKDPSLISRSIGNLEKELHIRLFNRSTRTLSLTEAGQRYLARVKPVLDELAFARDEAEQLNQSPSGLLRLTASTAFGQLYLVPAMSVFREAYPDIQLDLRLTDDNIDLFAEDIDLACRLSPSFQSDLIGHKLFDTCYRVCASPAYLERYGTPLSYQEVPNHHCLALSLPNYRSRWLFENEKKEMDEIRIAPQVFVSNALALRQLLLQGAGLGLAANWLIDHDIKDGKLVNIFPDMNVTATDFSTGAWLLYPSRKYVPLKTRVMIDFLKQYWSQNR